MEIERRWMIMADLRQVIAIENQCFEEPMDAESIRDWLRQRNTIGMVAVAKESQDVVGYMIYELYADRFQLQRIAVASSYQRQGIASQLLQYIENKLTPERRRRIIALVHDSMLPAHLFLKRNGYRATSIQGDEYYFFKGVLCLPQKTEQNGLLPANSGSLSSRRKC